LKFKRFKCELELQRSEENLGIAVAGRPRSFLDMTIILVSISLSQILHGIYSAVKCVFELCSPKYILGFAVCIVTRRFSEYPGT
jgi:hypothetical protein